MTAENFEVPDFFDSSDWQDIKTDDKRYRRMPVGEWIYHQNAMGEVVLPKVAKVVPMHDSGHSVVWVERIKLETDSNCNRCHQVICDCVMDMALEDVNNAQFRCEAVDQFIGWSALMARNELGIGMMMATYPHLRNGTRVPVTGEKIEDDLVLEGIISGVFKQVRCVPDKSYGNVASNKHSVTGLALVTGKPRENVLRVTENLQQTDNILLEDGEIIHLAAA